MKAPERSRETIAAFHETLTPREQAIAGVYTNMALIKDADSTDTAVTLFSRMVKCIKDAGETPKHETLFEREADGTQ